MINEVVRTGRGVAVMAAVLVMTAACGDEPVVSVQPPETSTTSTTSPSPSPSATSSSSSSTPASSSPTSTVTPSASATPTSTATATPSATAPSATAGRWPKALGEPQQGQPVWAVYLAVGHTNQEPAVEKAVRDAAGVGYSAVLGDLACDQGGIEGLGLDQYAYWTAATLYFATAKDAGDFAASYTSAVTAPKGVVKVRLGCLD